ncbi:MAG: CRTAC1 family protein [Candidatus Limnocylindria bacterium]
MSDVRSRIASARGPLAGLAATAIAALVAAAALLSAVWPSATPQTALPAPHFVEEARAAGINHAYTGDFEFFVGGGVAVFDCDDDGRPEMYLAGGSEPAALYHNDSPPIGTLRFTYLPDAATDLARVVGAYPLDIDSDGRLDLAVLRNGENVLLRGLGACRFERANEAWGFDGGDRWTAAFSATWEESAEWPTLAVGNYLDQSSTDTNRLCYDNELYRPTPDRTGYDSSQALSPGWCALSMLFSDWDRSGRRDLRVSNDRHYYRADGDGEEQLWRIAAGAPPHLYSHAEGWQTVRVWGMGIASADVTGDGHPEYYLTSQADNKLQTLTDGPGEPRFGDIALARGVTVHRPYEGDVTMPSTAWHAEFGDVNNDGLTDLFVAKGNVEAMPDYAARDPNNLLLGQPDGSFVEGARDAGIVTFARGRGGALADLNLDGLLDLVVVNRRENVHVWRNVGFGDAAGAGPMGSWTAIRLSQSGSNRDAVGSWIEVKVGEHVLLREVTVGGGHAGGQVGWIHFGLGMTDRAEVRVTWPDGEIGPWLGLEANGFAIVERGADAAQPWRPAQP